MRKPLITKNTVTPTSAWRAISFNGSGKLADKRLWQKSISKIDIALKPSKEGILFNLWSKI